MNLEAGLESRVRLSVKFEDLALHWGSDMPVLSTPSLVGHMEQACVRVTAGYLPEGSTTVGTGVEVVHISPTPESFQFEILAHLSKVDGKKLTFHVEVHDEFGLISTGTLHRAIVEKASFLSKVCRKMRSQESMTLNRIRVIR